MTSKIPRILLSALLPALLLALLFALFPLFVSANEETAPISVTVYPNSPMRPFDGEADDYHFTVTVAQGESIFDAVTAKDPTVYRSFVWKEPDTDEYILWNFVCWIDYATGETAGDVAAPETDGLVLLQVYDTQTIELAAALEVEAPFYYDTGDPELTGKIVIAYVREDEGKEGDPLLVADDFTLSAPIEIGEGQTISLDLCGHTLCAAEGSSLFCLSDGASLNVFSSAPGGKLVGCGAPFCVSEEGCSFTVGDAPCRGADLPLSAKSNLTLFSDFTYNLYIPVETFEDEQTASVFVGDCKIPHGEVTKIDGEDYFGFSYSGIDARNAAEDFVFRIPGTQIGNVSFETAKVVSIVDYAEKVLAIPELSDSHPLMVDMLNYLAEASLYFDGAVPEKIGKILEDQTPTAAPESFIGTDPGARETIFSGARYELSGKPAFIFYLRDGCTGSVTLSCGETQATFTVENGLCKGKDHLTFPVSVYDLNMPVSIEAGGETAAYSLSDYINAMAENDVLPLAKALYVYSATAETYKNTELGKEMNGKD